MLYIEDVDESIKYIYIESNLSRMLYIEDVDESKLSTSTESNLFSLLGTLILWIYWPSFMASGAIPGINRCNTPNDKNTKRQCQNII